MKITLAENLKKLRRARDLTQEDLAQFLGVTFQAVSKWERSEGYPDITMLPVIANYFEVTVDDLLGNDLISREERIEQYRQQYWSLNRAADTDESVAVAKKAYSEYPYEWGIIEIYILSLTRGFIQLPDTQTLEELRRICELVMKKCTDPIVRKRAIYSMTFAETDENVERWFAEAPDNADFLESERREERYIDRQQWDLYYPQKQQNMMDILMSLCEKMGYYNDPTQPEWKVESRRRRLDVFKILFTGTDRVLMSSIFTNEYIELAMALHDAGNPKEAIAELEKAVAAYEEHFAYAEKLGVETDEKVYFTDPMWNQLKRPTYPHKRSWQYFEKLANEPEYMQNETFRELLEKVRSLNNEAAK